MATQNDRDRARAGFEGWMGEQPDLTIEVAPMQGEGSPVEVLFFVDEGDDDDEPTTYIASAGLCSRSLTWAASGVELLLCVVGDFDLDELEPLGQMLGHLALALRQVEAEPAPGLLLEVGPLPVFEGMTCLLLTRWGQGDDSGLLETTPPVRILAINPLYEEEAVEVVKLTEDDALVWLDERGVDVDDPLRDSAFASEFAASAERTLAALNSQSSFEIASAMQQMSGSMTSWLTAAAPGFFDQFGAPQGDAPPPSGGEPSKK